jgi:hypothetical protein
MKSYSMRPIRVSSAFPTFDAMLAKGANARAVRPEAVDTLMGTIPRLNWDRNEPYIKGLREALDAPSAWSGCEDLANTLRDL